MSFLFSFPLTAAKQFAMHAEMSADHAKSSSLTEARMTPPMTMGRHSHLALLIFFLYTNWDRTAANAGSAALTICPKETDPAEKEKTDAEWAPA